MLIIILLTCCNICLHQATVHFPVLLLQLLLLLIVIRVIILHDDHLALAVEEALDGDDEVAHALDVGVGIDECLQRIHRHQILLSRLISFLG